jgi:hypothetical protein
MDDPIMITWGNLNQSITIKFYTNKHFEKIITSQEHKSLSEKNDPFKEQPILGSKLHSLKKKNRLNISRITYNF